MSLALICTLLLVADVLTASDPLPISSTTLLGSALPISGTEEARNCWNGLAVKRPSEVNQRENGALILRVEVLEGDFLDVVVTVTW